MPEKTCKDCSYFDKQQGNGDVGLCHRFPPQANFVPVQSLAGASLQLTGNFPPTPANGWCGELKPKLAVVNSMASLLTSAKPSLPIAPVPRTRKTPEQIFLMSLPTKAEQTAYRKALSEYLKSRGFNDLP